MRAVRPFEKAETAKRCQGTGDRVRYTFLEPADGSRADTGQHDSLLPSLAHDGIQAPVAPERQEIPGIPAANVDHILAQQEIAPASDWTVEDGEIRRFAVQRLKGLIESFDIIASVAAGRRHKAD